MRIRSLLALSLMLATMGVWAQSTGAPGTGITGTAHDWSSSGGGKCAVCHPSHQAKPTDLPWSPALSTTTYQWDQPATTAGTLYPKFTGNTYSGPSAQCLRCHDGSVVRGMEGVRFSRNVRGYSVASATGNMAGTHPVAVPYPLNGRASVYNGTINGPKIDGAEWVADPSVTNNIRLFNDDGSGSVAVGSTPGRTGIECTSCHDVHNGSRVKDSFLLVGLISGNSRSSGGYLCQQCHSK